MIPSVGRIVHYVSYGTKNGEYVSTCRAAVIAEVGQWVTTSEETDHPGQRRLIQEWHPEACAVSVLNPTGMFFNAAGSVPVDYDEMKAPGTWHWPERVEEHMHGVKAVA